MKRNPSEKSELATVRSDGSSPSKKLELDGFGELEEVLESDMVKDKINYRIFIS